MQYEHNHLQTVEEKILQIVRLTSGLQLVSSRVGYFK